MTSIPAPDPTSKDIQTIFMIASSICDSISASGISESGKSNPGSSSGALGLLSVLGTTGVSAVLLAQNRRLLFRYLHRQTGNRQTLSPRSVQLVPSPLLSKQYDGLRPSIFFISFIPFTFAPIILSTHFGINYRPFFNLKSKYIVSPKFYIFNFVAI